MGKSLSLVNTGPKSNMDQLSIPWSKLGAHAIYIYINQPPIPWSFGGPYMEYKYIYIYIYIVYQPQCKKYGSIASAHTGLTRCFFRTSQVAMLGAVGPGLGFPKFEGRGLEEISAQLGAEVIRTHVLGPPVVPFYQLFWLGGLPYKRLQKEVGALLLKLFSGGPRKGPCGLLAFFWHQGAPSNKCLFRSPALNARNFVVPGTDHAN